MSFTKKGSPRIVSPSISRLFLCTPRGWLPCPLEIHTDDTGLQQLPLYYILQYKAPSDHEETSASSSSTGCADAAVWTSNNSSTATSLRVVGSAEQLQRRNTNPLRLTEYSRPSCQRKETTALSTYLAVLFLDTTSPGSTRESYLDLVRCTQMEKATASSPAIVLTATSKAGEGTHQSAPTRRAKSPT